MEWQTIMAALGGGLSTGAPLAIWVWNQSVKIRSLQAKENSDLRAKEERDEYEMDKSRRSDAYQELSKSFDQFKTMAAEERAESKKEIGRLSDRIDAQNKKLDEVQVRELDCLRKSALQDAEIYKLNKVVDFLEGPLVKAMQAISPAPPTAAPSPAASVLAQAVKDVSKEG